MTGVAVRTLLWMLVFWIPLTASADSAQCLISFDSARFDACTGVASLADDDLAHLADVTAFNGSNTRVVKFDGPIHRKQRAALEAVGAEILDYAPFHTYVTRMSPASDAEVREIGGVVWVGPFLPVWKLEINLVNELREDGLVERAGLDHLVVSLYPGVDIEAGREALSRLPGLSHALTESGWNHKRLIFRFSRKHLAEAVASLAADERVAAIGLRWPHALMNSQADWLHQSGKLDVTPIFEQGIFGCGQILGVLDTGLHVDHCAFEDPEFGMPTHDACSSGAACQPITPDFGHRKVGAHYKWSGTNGGPSDSHGHGTHVIGSMVGNNLTDPVDCESFMSPGGLTDLDGTAPGARVISQEAGSSLDYINFLGGTIYHAAEVAVENGARIHNNSWGSSCRNQLGQCISGCVVPYSQTSRDADAVVWDYPELSLFVAAGNSGAGCGPGADVGAPGNAKNVFSIGSNRRGDDDGDSVSSFSSRGPASDRRTKPDLLAQGGGTTAPTAIHSAATDDCGIALASGTSMASPTAAGLAALVREYFQRGFYPFGKEIPDFAISAPSATLVKAVMVNGAHEIDGAGAGSGAPNQNQGWGRVHLDDALYFEGDDRRLWIHDDTAGLETGDVDVHLLTVEAGQPLKVTLAWHDYPAMVNANPHVVNQLRLEVETPDGQVWTQKLPADGDLFNPDPFQDITEGGYDGRNTIHQILLETPEAGAFEVRVRGIQVAQGGTQPYALAATGDLTDVGEPTFLMSALLPEAAVCMGETVSYDLELLSLRGFDDEVTLDVTSGLPPGAEGEFSSNPLVPAEPPASGELEITGTAGASAATYNIEITAESSGEQFPTSTRSEVVELIVDDQTPATGILLEPAHTAAGQPLKPIFEWKDFAAARKYRFQLSEHALFASLIEDVVVEGTSHTLSQKLEPNSVYYWRVAGQNLCGEGAFTSTYRFSTGPLPGECPIGTAASSLLFEDFSAGAIPAGWHTDGSAGEVTWMISDHESYQSGYSIFSENLDSVSDQRIHGPEFTLPATATAAYLNFQNWQHIESWPQGGCFDGGIVEITDDGGKSWMPIQNEQLLLRGYDGPVSLTWGNPLAGQQAWCGDPRDFWERQALDLSGWIGGNARFRFRFGTDGKQAHVGWYVDAVEVVACEPVTTEHTVGGLVTGLEGSGLVLRNRDGGDLPIETDGPFEFQTPLETGETYTVTVFSEPENPAQTCVVTDGSGTIESYDVTGVSVDCVADAVFGDRFEEL